MKLIKCIFCDNMIKNADAIIEISAKGFPLTSDNVKWIIHQFTGEGDGFITTKV